MKSQLRLVISLCGVLLSATVCADSAAWVVGKWLMSYDPDGARADTLEFTQSGDVISIGATGKRIQGMYVVSSDRVTTVFSQEGKQDVIATFFFDEQHQTLRIVTSKTGKETLYKKVDVENNKVK